MGLHVLWNASAWGIQNGKAAESAKGVGTMSLCIWLAGYAALKRLAWYVVSIF